MSRPVAKAGIAGAVLFAFAALCVLAVPAFLPSWHVAWLVKPLIGIEVSPLPAFYLGLGLGPGADLAVSVALDCIGVLAVAFHLDHCVINQPLWAVIGGWGLLLGGFLTMTLQEIVSTSQTTFIDIDHLLWPLGLVPASIGAIVVLLSWWRAPGYFSPHLSRWTLLPLVAAVAIVEAFAERNPAMRPAEITAIVVIGSVALIAGSWVTFRRSRSADGERKLGLTSVELRGSADSARH
jgi:hypothetical protein